MTMAAVSGSDAFPVTTQEMNGVTSGQALDDMLRKELEKFRESLWEMDNPRSAILISIYIPLFICSIVGNVFVLAIVLPFRKMRNVTHCFIVNLAISDLLLTLICVPGAVSSTVYKGWLYGKIMCKATGFMQGLTVSASVFTIAILSADRLLAIRQPMNFRIYRAGRHAWIIVAIVWIASVVVTSPLLAVRQLNIIELKPVEPIMFCLEKWPSRSLRLAYDVTLFVLLFAIPGIFIVLSYSLIGRQLWIEDGALHGGDCSASLIIHSRQTKKILSGRRRIARMLGAVALVFAICWMPYQLLSLYISFLDSASDQKGLAQDALPFTILLGHSNSVFNPLLYFVMTHHLHDRRKRSQQPAPNALVAGGRRSRPSRDAPAPVAAGARDEWNRGAATVKLPASCRGQREQDFCKHKRYPAGPGGEANVTPDSRCNKTGAGCRMEQHKVNITKSLSKNALCCHSINAVLAATQLTASISGGYCAMQSRVRQRCGRNAIITTCRRRSDSDGIDSVATTGYEHCQLPPPEGARGSHRPVRRASLGSPTSLTSPTTTTSVGSSMAHAPPRSPVHDETDSVDRVLNIELEIPTAIRE